MRNFIQFLSRKTLLGILVLLASFTANAKDKHFSGAITGTNILNGATFNVVDDKLLDMMPPLQWQDDFQNAAVKNYIILSLNPVDLTLQPAFTLTVNCKITYLVFNSATPQTYTKNISLNIDYNNNPKEAYKAKAIYSFTNAHSIDVQVTGVVCSQGPVPLNVKLEAVIDVERYFYFAPNDSRDYAIIFSPSATNINVDWADFDFAESYDMEYTWVDDQVPPGTTLKFDFSNNSTRINTTNSYYDIPNVFEKGYLLVRVRAISRNITVSDPDRFVYDSWWPVASNNEVVSYTAKTYISTTHFPALNWQYGISFAEEGKRKDVISYFDGTLRNRQTVTNQNTDNVSLIKETIYDHHGRPAIEVMPAPTNDYSSAIQYYQNFNVNASSNPYSSDDFDIEPTQPPQPSQCVDVIVSEMNNTSGASKYYSSSNIKKDQVPYSFIPDAFKYPFSQTEYMPDNTGRIRRQGGIGPYYQLGAHDTKYLYARPEQEEINKLFGTEIGIRDRYMKNVVIDPNGQISISYINFAGKTVASALAGATPNENSNDLLDPLLSNVSGDVTIDLIHKNSVPEDLVVDMQKGTITLKYSTTCEKDGNYVFHYYALGEDFHHCMPEKDICYTCTYNLDISIKDDCGRETYKNFGGGGGNDYPISETIGIYQTQSCSIPEPDVEKDFTISFEAGKTYFITKVLTVDKAVMDMYFNNYVINCAKKYTDFLNEELAKIDTTICFPFGDCLEEAVKELGDGSNWSGATIDGIIFPATNDGYQRAIKRYASNCEYEPTCSYFMTAMESDLRPKGQYALYDVEIDANGNEQIVLPPAMKDFCIDNYPEPNPDFEYNIFTRHAYNNVVLIRKKGLTGNDEGFRRPLYENDENKPYYYDENTGKEAYIILERIDNNNNGDDFNPPVLNFSDADFSTGKYRAYPHKLKNATDFIKYYQLNPSWSKSLLYLHPEFCMSDYCSDFEPIDKFGYYLLDMDSYNDAKASEYGYIDKNNFQALKVKDPFYTSYLSSVTYSNPKKGSEIRLRLDDALLNYFTDINGTYNILQFAVREVYGYTSLSEINNYIYNEMDGDICLHDLVWQIYRNLYLGKRMEFIEESRIQYAIIHKCYNGCIGEDHTPYCEQYNPAPEYPKWNSDFYCLAVDDNFNSKYPIPDPCDRNYYPSSDFYGPILETQQICYYKDDYMLKDKYPRFPSMKSVFKMSDYEDMPSDEEDAQTMLCEECNSTCNAYADYWMEKLIGCQSCTTYTEQKWTDLRNEFIQICIAGCDAESPIGAIEKDPSPDSYNCTSAATYTDFNAAIKGILGIACFNTECTQDLIGMPGKYEHQFFAESDNHIDECGCDKIKETKEEFDEITPPPSDMTWMDLFEEKYKFEIDEGTLCACQLAWDAGSTVEWQSGLTWNQTQKDQLAKFPIFTPYTISCKANGNCIFCDDIEEGFDELENLYGTTYSDPIITNYLNNKYNFNLTANEYLAFKESCLTSSDTSCHENEKLILDLKKIFELLAQRDELDKVVCLNLPPYKDFYIPTLSDLACTPPPNCTDFTYDGEWESDYSALHMNFPYCSVTLNRDPDCENIPPENFVPEHAFISDFGVIENDPDDSHSFFVTICLYTIPRNNPDPYVYCCKYIGTNNCWTFRECEPPNQLCNITEYEVENECVDKLIKQAELTADEKYDEYIKKFYDDFSAEYISECIKIKDTEEFTAEYGSNIYHYTLYYYDASGNLVKTVPPAGVKLLSASLNVQIDENRVTPPYTPVINDHILPTNYKYNSLNQLVEQKTPDGGVTKFWYDRIGRMVLSQNAKQAATNPLSYSYTLYDKLGRIVEVGEIATSVIPETSVKNVHLFKAFITGGTRKDLTITCYDDNDSYPAGSSPQSVELLFTGGQQNLRGRVSASFRKEISTSSTYTAASYFSYDFHGNVKELVQDIPALEIVNNRYKLIQYEYDLISGKVNYVYYQKGKEDAFTHKYYYDAENRITEVFTSQDRGATFERDAKYYYYLHGPLARVELGNFNVQAIDYAYTLQGWLKGVNSETLMEKRDQGRDGDLTITNPHLLYRKMIPKDQFGFSLQYNNSDYSSIKTFPALDYFLANKYPLARPLYNGNITSMVSSIFNSSGDAIPILQNFTYDQLNRLLTMNCVKGYDNNVIANNSWTNGQSLNSYITQLSYDANGNILTLFRNGSFPADMDNLTYKYDYITPGVPSDGMYSNRLYHIKDSYIHGVDENYNEDINDQGVFDNNHGTMNTVNNYGYDQIGNLIRDDVEKISSIEWDAYGKIKKINRTGICNNPDLEFRYDAMGNRIEKIVKPRSEAGGSGDLTKWIKTWYIRDASGNIMATYDQWTVDPEEPDLLKINELSIYGSSRIGVLNKDLMLSTTIGKISTYFDNYLGKKHFELTNHLGNVMAVVSDKKIPVDNTVPADGQIDFFTADLIESTDYYPFGMRTPNRGTTIPSDGGYRFGYNGKEYDAEWNGNPGAMYDYGFRILDPRIGKFLSVDPLTKDYPMLTPYQYASNSPIWYIDLDGLEGISFVDPKKYPDINNAALKQPDKDAIHIYVHAASTFIQPKVDNKEKVIKTPQQFDVFLSTFSDKWKNRKEGENLIVVIHGCKVGRKFAKELSKAFKDVKFVAPNERIYFNKKGEMGTYQAKYQDDEGEYTRFNSNGKPVKEKGNIKGSWLIFQGGEEIARNKGDWKPNSQDIKKEKENDKK